MMGVSLLNGEFEEHAESVGGLSALQLGQRFAEFAGRASMLERERCNDPGGTHRLVEIGSAFASFNEDFSERSILKSGRCSCNDRAVVIHFKHVDVTAIFESFSW